MIVSALLGFLILAAALLPVFLALAALAFVGGMLAGALRPY